MIYILLILYLLYFLIIRRKCIKLIEDSLPWSDMVSSCKSLTDNQSTSSLISHIMQPENTYENLAAMELCRGKRLYIYIYIYIYIIYILYYFVFIS